MTTVQTISTPVIPDEAEGGMEAPVIYFEAVATQGVGLGVGRMSLEMLVMDPTAEGTPVRYRRRIVAQLRGPASAWDSMRQALGSMDAMAATSSVPEGKPN